MQMHNLEPKKVSTSVLADAAAANRPKAIVFTIQLSHILVIRSQKYTYGAVRNKLLHICCI